MTTTPDRWFVLSVGAPVDGPRRDLIADALIELGGHSVLESEQGLSTFLLPPVDADALLSEARALLGQWTEPDPPSVSWRWQPNEDWNLKWRRGLQPRKVSRRFVVKPTWTEWTPAENEIVVDIDPQMAFGTGEHATTRGCLRLLDQTFREGSRVLDIGSGSAILAIAAARLGATQVTAVEYDPDANINARENIARNGVEDRVTVREQLATPELIGSLGPVELIMANILSGVIRPLLPSFHQALLPGGVLIVSGILHDEHKDVLADAAAAGLRLRSGDVEEEWWSAALEKIDEAK